MLLSIAGPGSSRQIGLALKQYRYRTRNFVDCGADEAPVTWEMMKRQLSEVFDNPD